MNKTFKKERIRVTTDILRWVAIYALLAFILGMLTSGAFWVAYIVFSGVNKDEPLLNPMATTTITEVKKEDSWLEAMYQTIRWHESNDGTTGLAITCAKRGKINETGFRAHQGYCFSSREQQEIETKQWLADKITIKGMSKFQAMRLYTNNAPYSYLFK